MSVYLRHLFYKRLVELWHNYAMLSSTISRYLAAIGQRGGEAGRGASKRRDLAFYRAISKKGLKTRRANARARRKAMRAP